MNTKPKATPVAALVTRAAARITPDPARVVTKMFVPGEEMPEHESRSAAVITRVMALDGEQVEAALARVIESYDTRHRDLRETFTEHFESVKPRFARSPEISERRRLLIGACFTHEYAIEAAALCNPSMVPHPDQDGLGPGETRFVLSARGIGEGHLSCVEFRTGTAGPGGRIELDATAPYSVVGRARPLPDYDLALFEAVLAANGDDDEVAAFLHRHLSSRFTGAQLDRALERLPAQLVRRQGTQRAIERVRLAAACTYDVEFPADTELSERVLWPSSPAEQHGIEDARFVHFTDDDGAQSYFATYTAFDGSVVAPQLMHTTDFRTFRVSQLTGQAAGNKGMALFPRRVDGKYLALSRWDRESTALATSVDNRTWDVVQTIQTPRHSWELIQIGNCGSPIETEAGWLVLTHGVGPMRTYCIGAILLDLDHPQRIVGCLDEPLIAPNAAERDGYVPNVVYSCGPMRNQDSLVIPYGTSDTAIRFATVPIPELLDRMRPNE